MHPFDKIKEQWAHQEEVRPTEREYNAIWQKIRGVKKKQYLTNVILGATLAVLIYFFFYIAAYNSSRAMLGLSIMIGTLLLRVLLEQWSIITLGKMNAMQQMKTFQQALVAYYQRRKRTHYLYTPILMIGYVVGFVLLLPLFKANLSSGFYTYILWSGSAVLLALSWLIAKQVAKELATLRALRDPGA